jgi:hypothetical protein
MKFDRARQMAEFLLMANTDEKAFEVDIWSADDTKVVASALESLGCKVDRDPFKYRLIVTPRAT